MFRALIFSSNFDFFAKESVKKHLYRLFFGTWKPSKRQFTTQWKSDCYHSAQTIRNRLNTLPFSLRRTIWAHRNILKTIVELNFIDYRLQRNPKSNSKKECHVEKKF